MHRISLKSLFVPVSLGGVPCVALLVGLLACHSADAALLVSNGDFEADDLAANSEGGGVDITDWYESEPTSSYYEWMRDDADMGAPTGGAGGAGVAEDNNWAAFSGNSAGNSTLGELFLHQSIGTLSAGTPAINVSGVSSDRGDRAGTGRHSAIIQVSLWYDNGTATLADGTDLAGTAGLTMIGAQSVGASVGGAFTAEGGGAPDIDLTTLDPAGQALSEAWEMSFDLGASGVSAGDSVYLQLKYFDSDTVNSRSEAYFDNISVSEVPEPTTALLAAGSLVLLALRRKA